MDIVLIVLRILLMTFGLVVSFFYILAQMWQKLPAPKFALKMSDYLTYGAVGFCFGLGLNNNYALLAFLPLLLWKVLASSLFSKNKVAGKGRWMEVQWQRFSPRGFRMPQEAVEQIKRLPGDTHFLIPRFVSLWAVKYFMKNMRKNTHKMPAQMRGQEHQAMDMLEGIARNVSRMDAGKTEKLSLPFGELKITRL